MKIIEFNKLAHSAEPLSHKPDELEHDELSVHVITDNEHDPQLMLYHSRKHIYDRRSKTDRIFLKRNELEQIISVAKATLEQIDQGEIALCKCGNYYHIDEVCKSCLNERIRLFRLGGNNMVRAWGYDPIEETSD